MATSNTKSRERRSSITDSDTDDDEETAKEVEDLKRHGILPPDFPEKDGLFEKYDDFDLSKEVDELLGLGEITQDEAKEITDKESILKHVTSDSFLDPHIADREQMMPAFSSDGLPISWVRGLREDKPYHLVALKKGEPEFDIIAEEFEKVNIKIKVIERLQNRRLLKRFIDELGDVTNHRCEAYSPNVRYLYHGTNVEKGRICEEGLDQRLSRMGYFGKGIYFSDTPLKCVHYSNDPGTKNPEEAYILKCRVILGDAKIYAQGCYDTRLRREPEKPDQSDGWRYFDSVVGCPKDYNEYVVYENRRAMIEYIISFKVDKKLMTAIKNITSSKVSDTKTSQVLSGSQRAHGQDEHKVNIVEVREAVRRKTQLQAGKQYIPPTQDQSQEDDRQSTRLQKTHQTYRTTLKDESSKQSNYDTDLKILRTAPLPQQMSKPSMQKGAQAKSSTSTLDNDVQKVLDSCIMEFLAVTDVNDSKLARYYIQKANMDVNQAISYYYEDMG
ncbi:hypothetical protein ACF0H5_018507 [Mactra antiquata]